MMLATAAGLRRRVAVQELAVALKEWESFYVIIGSSAAALTGLMFVVIALQSESRLARAGEASQAFATPTVVHFCGVLLVAAILSTPGHTVRSLFHCLLATGVAGLAFSAIVVNRARRQKVYAMVTEDWLWHMILPALAYAAVVAAAITLLLEPHPALYVVGAATVILLFIGIHNAWDAALWIAERKA
jgi:hypothetical protein